MTPSRDPILDKPISRASITKDPSGAQPWGATLHYTDGSLTRRWCSGFKTLRSLTEFLDRYFAYTSIPWGRDPERA
jgi:hypothetical protein